MDLFISKDSFCQLTPSFSDFCNDLKFTLVYIPLYIEFGSDLFFFSVYTLSFSVVFFCSFSYT